VRRSEIVGEAKEAWRNRIRDASVYPFKHEMRLVEKIAQKIPEGKDLVVLGGGVGLLPQLMRKVTLLGRVINIEVAPVRNGYVPTVQADMEEPFVGKMGDLDKPAIIGAFSIEYTNIRKTTANIADALLEGEKFVWVAHHEESEIVRQLRRERQLTERLIEYRDRIFRDGINLEEAKKLNQEANQIFEEDYDLIKMRPTKVTDLMVRRNLNYEYGRVIIIFSRLRFDQQRAQEEYDRWMEFGKFGMKASAPLFSGIELTQDGINRSVDPRLKVKKSEIYEFDFRPKAIICEFEKRN
jgi:hypothetical protein